MRCKYVIYLYNKLHIIIMYYTILNIWFTCIGSYSIGVAIHRHRYTNHFSGPFVVFICTRYVCLYNIVIGYK